MEAITTPLSQLPPTHPITEDLGTPVANLLVNSHAVTSRVSTRVPQFYIGILDDRGRDLLFIVC